MLLQDITGSLLMLQLVSILSHIFVIWVQGSIQMCPHCRLNTAYCYGLRTWIFGRNPWTDADQTFTICTPLSSHSIHAATAVLATHEAIPHRCRRRRLEQGRCWVGKVQIKQWGVVTRSWSWHAVMFVASVGQRCGVH